MHLGQRGSDDEAHVNSLTRRKLNNARQHAAQNITWSKTGEARALWRTRITGVSDREASGMTCVGRRTLNPTKKAMKKGVRTKGSGRPASICSDRAAERYSRIDDEVKRWTEDNHVTNSMRVHSKAGNKLHPTDVRNAAYAR